jgi:hypothetical protein
MMKNPPTCSFVSAKGPSVTEGLPFLGRSVVAELGGASDAWAINWPLARSASSWGGH